MAAYQAPAAPTTQVDPTDVMAKRVGAFLIDLMIVIAAFLVPFLALAETESNTGLDSDLKLEFIGDNFVILSGDFGAVLETWEFWVVILVGVAAGIVIHWIVAGLKGVTPGKLAVGIIVVDEQGQIPGVPKAIIRNLLYVVDALPYLVPYIVGLVVALTTTGHRRVGDIAAKTYVVDRPWAGYPVPVAQATPYAEAYGAPTATQQPVSQQPAAQQPAVQQPAVQQPAVQQSAAQWDPQRNAWVQWDPTQQGWLQWSDAEQRWGPLS